MTGALDRLRREHLHKFAAYLEENHMTDPPFAVIARHDCMCGGTGWITVVYKGSDDGAYGDSDAYDFPCPNGCPQPELPPVQRPS